MPKGFFGIAPGVSHLDSKDYKKMRKTKVKSYRVSVFWKGVEPQPGVYQWDGGRRSGGRARQERDHPDPDDLGGAPVGNRQRQPGGSAPEGQGRAGLEVVPQDRGEALQEGRRSTGKTTPASRPKPVKSWQIWNEPNLPKYFAKPGQPAEVGAKTAKSYAKLVKSSDKAIGKADKHGKVMLAGLSSKAKKKKLEPNTFIKKFLKAKKITKRFSAAALHPYAPKISKYDPDLELPQGDEQERREEEADLADRGGLGIKHGHGNLNKGKSGQAKLLKQSFKVTLKKRNKWGIDRLLWFDWRDPPKGARGLQLLPVRRAPQEQPEAQAVVQAVQALREDAGQGWRRPSPPTRP